MLIGEKKIARPLRRRTIGALDVFGANLRHLLYKKVSL